MAAASLRVRSLFSPRRAYNAASGSSTRVRLYNNTLFHRGTVLTWPPTEREQSLDPSFLSDGLRTTVFACLPAIRANSHRGSALLKI
jgi:hypothetical protein